MTSLANKRVLLGVTGGIAAYKAAELTRRLRDAGAHVRVAMTAAAREFVTPLTFQALSGNPVHTDLLDPRAEAAMGHIELARWADCVLVAPASADFIARLAHGLADDLLSTLCLATDAPIALAPAMNRLMWASAATQANCDALNSRGVRLFGPGAGDQACGEEGPGRMLEPDALVAMLADTFVTGMLAGLKVLVTAGPTREAIDPVRYISNRSSGRMGFALARAAAEAGANVTLVSGPVTLGTPASVTRIDVETAEEMCAAVLSETPDVMIACAAVADYRPAESATPKMKKSGQPLSLQLIPNPDVIAAVATSARPPFTVGFAAETEDLTTHAQAKLAAKRLDMIAANLVGAGRGFESEDNALEVFWPGGHRSLASASKERLARDLIALIAQRYRSTRGGSLQPLERAQG
ncbi:MAG: bifunctional phosphopantothenoylcysteine decarboxylase/phosphopantothenate--cysteine ligase CoaBC [Gammaproteobacteria bacterium]|nr:bifunctional phosphopantothenoylcysteine decarboxylase/phosphopantothenate--cysteine ligase CoaBC [Gammaproteobacteria bacterium]MBA3731064.1 bifunctional phosphopantothenoylcysteine decarboxylase/phosphopantothenate--cysteine ligase CoaBC [Gammaproteobacteria bacterium]